MKLGSKAKRILLAALAAVLCLGVCFSVYTVIKQNKKAALTADAYAATDVVGEIYNSSNNSFSRDNLQILAKKAGYPGGINAMINDAATPKTAADLVTKNGNKEWSVTLGGLKWNPMYLSKTNDGKAILTLWLAESDVGVTYSDGTYAYYDKKTYNEGSTTVTVFSNSYDGSYIRHYLLNGDTNYASFDDGTAIAANKYESIKNTFEPFRTSGSLGDFVVAPSNVQWQINESSNRSDIGYTGTGYKYYTNYWQNDKLWLPSLTEVSDGTGGLWGTSAAQRSNSKFTWMRTASAKDVTNYYYSSVLLYDGSSDHYDVNISLAMRPAFHLDLEAVAAAAGYPEPENFEIEYSGTDRAFASLSAAELPDWYGSLSAAANITYEDSSGAGVSTITDAGTYKAIYELKDNTKSFVGTPDTTKGESATKRIRTFKVTQKELPVTLAKDASGLPEITSVNNGAGYGTDTNAMLKDFVRLKYSGGGITAGQEYTVPKKAGSYTATAEIDTSKTGAGNYKLASPAPSITFSIVAKQIKAPSFAAATQPYTGSPVHFALDDFDPDAMTISNLSSFTQGTDYTYDATNKKYTFNLTDVQSTDVSLTVQLKQDVSRVWDDGSGDGDKTITFNLTPKPLTITFTSSVASGAFSWQKGETGTITISHDGAASDTIELDCNYYGTSPATPSQAITGDSLDISTLDVGDYEVSVALAAASTNNDNGNYSLASVAKQPFSIGAKQITLSSADISWQYVNANINGGAAQALAGATLTYNGKDFTVKIDESKLPTGVAVDKYDTNTSATAGPKNTTVYLKCLAGYSFATGSPISFPVNWNIDKAD